MFRKKKKEKEQAQDIRLASQIDEEESFLSLMGRMARENKLAAASAVLILVFILAAIFAPFRTACPRLLPGIFSVRTKGEGIS